MLDDLRDRLADATDAKFSEAMKLRFLNRGQAAMFPRIFQIVRDSSLALESGTYEYDIPAAVGSNGRVVMIEAADVNGRFWPVANYEVIPGLTDPILKLTGGLPGPDDADIRITAAMPLTAFASSASTYTGPPVTEELPVLYAMSLCMARDVEAKLSVRRMPTIEGLNGSSESFMTASQFWMQQFEILLDRLQMPLPTGF